MAVDKLIPRVSKSLQFSILCACLGMTLVFSGMALKRAADWVLLAFAWIVASYTFWILRRFSRGHDVWFLTVLLKQGWSRGEKIAAIGIIGCGAIFPPTYGVVRWLSAL